MMAATLRPTLCIQICRHASTLQSVNESLAARGYLRPHKPYTPPEDVKERLSEIFASNASSDSQLSNGRIKFKILNACFKEFGHSVPNSKLHEINTKDDVEIFYSTPVDTRVPLDKFKEVDLPANLHIQYEYHRFHPDTDTKFGGISAFPKRSTIVTGLKYKDKYPGYVAKPSWH